MALYGHRQTLAHMPWYGMDFAGVKHSMDMKAAHAMINVGIFPFSRNSIHASLCVLQNVSVGQGRSRATELNPNTCTAPHELLHLLPQLSSGKGSGYT